jgi:CMP/dCMP kinase
MIITISGPGGSGKSTIAKKLTEKLNAERIYVGGIRREYAKKMGMTLNELNELALTNPESDVGVDKAAAKKARDLEKNKLVIVEGRTQFHFLPESLKLYIKCDIDESVKRIWKDLNENTGRNEKKPNSMHELKQLIIEREQSDLARYKKYYNINHKDESHYDHIIDTTNITANQATEIILKLFRNNLKS